MKPSLREPSFLSFLPVVYVAWADGALDDAELRALSDELETLPSEVGQRARAWLDPAEPPTATELAEVLHLIKDAAAGLDARDKESLAALGTELAERAGARPTDDEAAAVVRLERALGVDGRTAVGDLVWGPPAVPAPEPVPSEADGELDADGVRAIAGWLDGVRADGLDRARRLLDELGPPPHDLESDAHRALTLARLRQLADEGLGATAYPGVTHDGETLADFLALFEGLGYGDGSLLVKFGVQFGLFGGSIYFLGSDEQRERYLPDVAAGRLLGCFAMTETGHGSNVMRLETRARYLGESDEIEIHTPIERAGKDYIGNAARDGRMATVFAQLEVDGNEHGVHAILVPIRDDAGAPLPGVRIGDDGHKIGLNGVDNGRLWFERVRVPRANLLSRFASIGDDGSYQSEIASPNARFFTMLGTLVGGRVSVAAAGLSAAKSGLSIALRYGARRRQFGEGEAESVLLDYRSYQRRLLPGLAKTYAINCLVRYAQDRYLARTEDDAREVEALAAAVKAYSTWNTRDVLQECREACGGAGYLSENRIGGLRRDTDVYTTFEGDNTVLQLLVAKSLLSEFRERFNDGRALAMARLIAKRATTKLVEMNPVATRNTDREHLLSAEFHGAAFAYRERSLLRSVAMRLKKRIDGGLSPFAAQAQIQDHLLSLANAHVEHLALVQFRARLDAGELAGAARDAVERLYQLYALSAIERDGAWFVEQDYLSSSKYRAIRRAVNWQCGQVATEAVPLVNALGAPDACIDVPILRSPAAQPSSS